MSLPTHFLIPDTQVDPGVPTDHLTWIGQYLVDQFAGHENLRVIHLGDHANMGALSSYDKGKKAAEGRRYQEDIEAANAGFDKLCAPLDEYNRTRRAYKEKQWAPDLHFLLGNHEDRISRAVESNAELEGKLSLDDLNYGAHGWTVHPFLSVAMLDGVAYSHYFYQPNSGRPYGGMAETRLRTVGHSFSQGHQQGLQTAQRSFLGQRQRALIAGSCYLHEEVYRGPQAADEWRGILVCHEVENGNYDLMEVSLNFLARKYEGMSLSSFMRRKYKLAA